MSAFIKQIQYENPGTWRNVLKPGTKISVTPRENTLIAKGQLDSQGRKLYTAKKADRVYPATLAEIRTGKDGELAVLNITRPADDIDEETGEPITEKTEREIMAWNSDRYYVNASTFQTAGRRRRRTGRRMRNLRKTLRK